MKRIYCLYRVSTLGQVDKNGKDDIPMQKQAWNEFAERQGWKIVEEYQELGVSGFKVSAKDRDVIQDIQKAAVEGKFDILLVFMFDRIGRREDETPFVVEWFARQGIKVWSAQEGQQRFDNHTDKLMNYIRYWQASGESIKTPSEPKRKWGRWCKKGISEVVIVPMGIGWSKKVVLIRKVTKSMTLKSAPMKSKWLNLFSTNMSMRAMVRTELSPPLLNKISKTAMAEDSVIRAYALWCRIKSI